MESCVRDECEVGNLRAPIQTGGEGGFVLGIGIGGGHGTVKAMNDVLAIPEAWPFVPIAGSTPRSTGAANSLIIHELVGKP